ncbi:Cytokinin riboside 5'-monophosphate phosphoribohydrolase LOG protein [Dioscorea alata]|uniref:Cytokinin riboside 5'-monophosphate phosphoribohydrolase LOG protein n=1 Tax=Dioscorea alata TaxID=55571 RepID=A0ACB7W147_DIOAL|nr:Cytokinin riboside 5'-monophosphate phosphoribohydrolase LOG protein [Dioscorea alata]
MGTLEFKTICVFCGCNLGKKKSYQYATIDLDKELITGVTIGELKPVADMHQRKTEMTRNSDAFIAMSGGYDTFEELFEVINWAQLDIHNKPVGLLNVDGYYNSLPSFIDQAIDKGFIKPNARPIIVSASNAIKLIEKLEAPRHKRVKT